MTDCANRIARTPEGLDALIEQATPEHAAENCERIMADYGIRETGRATEALVNYILDKLDRPQG